MLYKKSRFFFTLDQQYSLYFSLRTKIVAFPPIKIFPIAIENKIFATKLQKPGIPKSYSHKKITHIRKAHIPITDRLSSSLLSTKLTNLLANNYLAFENEAIP